MVGLNIMEAACVEYETLVAKQASVHTEEFQYSRRNQQNIR